MVVISHERGRDEKKKKKGEEEKEKKKNRRSATLLATKNFVVGDRERGWCAVGFACFQQCWVSLPEMVPKRGIGN